MARDSWQNVVVLSSGWNTKDMVPSLHRPRPPLNAFAECFWYFPAYKVKHTRERALPTGTVELVVNLGQDRMRIFRDEQDGSGHHFNDSVVCGPHSRYFVLDTSQSAPAVGIHFRPGGSTPFFFLPTNEMTDHHVALDDLWGPWARQVRERLMHAASPEHMFVLLEQVLLSRLKESHLLHPAVAYAVRKLTAFPQVVRIRQVQNETGYGAKRFIELFSGAVGLTPKVYSRIQRFQAVIERIARGDRVEWADVAADGGYCDQSHLNREFRVFAGVTPALYQPVARNRPSHIAAN